MRIPLHLTFWIGLFAFATGAPFPLYGQPAPAVIMGTVVNEQGPPMPYVNVQLTGTTEGAATQNDGHFQFITRRTGMHRLRATRIGYDFAERRICLAPGDTISVRLVLKETLVSLDEALITARAFTTGDLSEATTLKPLEVVTTPGAAADIFRALQTFPGTATVDDGAGLFVRGGDVSETKVLLDQATVHYPYRYESPTGGVFGTIPPFLVSGTHFSTGGFSAKYGDALSGVLAMESQDRPQQSHQYVNLGLAAASLGLDVPLVDDALGLRFSGNRSFTGLLFRVNGQRDDFETVPQGTNGNLSLVWNYSPTGQLKLFNYASTNRLGVEVEEPSFMGTYRGRETTWLHNLQWKELVGAWLVTTSASLGRHTAHRQLGNLDLRPRETNLKLRTDLERELSEDWRLLAGGTAEHRINAFRGTIPQQPDVLAPSAAPLVLDEQHAATRFGGYFEIEAQPTRRLVATAGLRTDVHTPTDQAVVDPRLSLQYLISKRTRARLAWGLYHQFPSPEELGPEQGNPTLQAQRAQHVITGLRHERNPWLLRLEAYYKPYDHLVVRDDEPNYRNAGTGRARGLDLFAKYGTYLETRFNGWLSYSVLQSRRTQARDRGETITLEQGPAPFDITHTLNVVGKMRLASTLYAGLRYTAATGRPITPVRDAIPANGGTYYLPIDGPVGSERLPYYHTLDLQLSYYYPFGTGQSATFYVALNNALDRAKIIGYDYALDYSTRTLRTTNFRRSIYFGLSVML